MRCRRMPGVYPPAKSNDLECTVKDARPLFLVNLEESLDVSSHNITQVLDLELQMALSMLDDLLNLPIHRVKGVI